MKGNTQKKNVHVFCFIFCFFVCSGLHSSSDLVPSLLSFVVVTRVASHPWALPFFLPALILSLSFAQGVLQVFAP